MKAVSRLTIINAPPNDSGTDLDVIDAIVKTVAYADIFDYPLTAAEIHRYLIGLAVSRDRIHKELEDDSTILGRLSHVGDYFVLPGREEIASIRQHREVLSRRFWTRAVRYGRLISSLPFVRMVAVTGELAMDNVREESDIDFFIVTEHHRVWLCRLFVVGIVKAAGLLGDVVCPNYLLSERMLALDEHNLYTAHEVVQMVPISGLDVYGRFRRENRWVYDFLPNAITTQRALHAGPHSRPVRAIAEAFLRTPLGAVVERWEMRRKIRKFATDADRAAEASFSADWCKGHVHDHGRLILAAYSAHSAELEGTGS
ncbi:MAG: hypothetical protein WBW04_09450 [Nitrolancea sp.]